MTKINDSQQSRLNKEYLPYKQSNQKIHKSLMTELELLKEYDKLDKTHINDICELFQFTYIVFLVCNKSSNHNDDLMICCKLKDCGIK